jgi:tRNA(Ile)-lysidine synthase
LKNSTNTILSSLSNTLNAYPDYQRIWIAYSGGLDSHVLLHAASQLWHKNNTTLCAIHIHHGLNKDADLWAVHCQNICAELGIPCEVVPVKITCLKGESVESCARKARYSAISERLSDKDIVLTAQHADDQAETLLLQLLRGSGISGLAAMPRIHSLGKGKLIRPFLDITRAELRNYAESAGLTWLEDSSNFDTRFDRNYLRHAIVPLLKRRWSGVTHILGRAARHQAEAHYLLKDLGKIDFQHCQGTEINQISIGALLTLSPARQANVIRYWLNILNLPLPSAAQLHHILNDMLTAKPDSRPLVRWQGADIRRYAHHLFAMPNLPEFPPNESLTWLPPAPLTLPIGYLIAEETMGQGLIFSEKLTIRFRQGGESCRWHGHQRPLKKIVHSNSIYPWLRGFIPLIYQEDILVAIPNVGVCEDFTAKANEKGLLLQWIY